MKYKYDFTGKVAAVVGGSSGIGLATAAQLTQLGCLVYNVSRGNIAPPDNSEESNLSSVYSRLRCITADVTNPSSLHCALNDIYNMHGRLDILVYSAGFSMASPVEHALAEDIKYLFDVNFFGATVAAQTAIPLMRKNDSGKIVFVSSLGGVFPIAYDAFYSASKAALNMLTRQLKTELKPYNIDVCAVMPGGTATRFTFKRKVYPAEAVGTYNDKMQKAVVSLANIEQGGENAESVAACIISAIGSSNPKPLIASGLVNKSGLFVKRLLPTKTTDSIVNMLYKQ